MIDHAVIKDQSLPSSLDGGNHSSAFKDLRTRLFYPAFSFAESVGGLPLVSLLTEVPTRRNRVKRQVDFAQFVRLRGIMPEDFWKGSDPEKHYLKMIRCWYESLGTALCYHRLGAPHWQKRFQIRGTPPQALPDSRPIILVFLHTGPFGLVRYWLRSKGVACASLVDAMPRILLNEYYQKITGAGDARYRLEGVPQHFIRPGELRDAMRFLTPGHVLTVALDGASLNLSLASDRYDAGGFPIFVKSGACRMAAQTNAMVIPVSIRRTAPYYFELFFGKPVPDELIETKNFNAATQHLISELWPAINEDPSVLNWTTMEALAPQLKIDRVSWP